MSWMLLLQIQPVSVPQQLNFSLFFKTNNVQQNVVERMEWDGWKMVDMVTRTFTQSTLEVMNQVTS